MISLTSPVDTMAHRWPASVKLAALCLATMALFVLDGVLPHAAICLGVLGLYAVPGVAFMLSGLRALRVLWPFVLVALAWHGITEDYRQGAIIVMRLTSAVALANLVTMTTRLTDIIDLVRRLAAPLRRVGVQTRPLEIAIALVVRMTPVLTEKAGSLAAAWRARSAGRVGWRVVLPFVLLVLDDADHVSDALRARGGLVES